MAKTKVDLDAFGVASVLVGALSLATVFVVGSYFGIAWLADYLYSGTFEAQGVGPTVSFWQFVGFTVLVRLLKGGFEFKKSS